MQRLQNYHKTFIPRIFPTYSSNPKGPNFALYCKYQLLRYKPWQYNQNNAWANQEPTDDSFIAHWQEFLQTPYAEVNVPLTGLINFKLSFKVRKILTLNLINKTVQLVKSG